MSRPTRVLSRFLLTRQDRFNIDLGRGSLNSFDLRQRFNNQGRGMKSQLLIGLRRFMHEEYILCMWWVHRNKLTKTAFFQLELFNMH